MDVTTCAKSWSRRVKFTGADRAVRVGWKGKKNLQNFLLELILVLAVAQKIRIELPCNPAPRFWVYAQKNRFQERPLCAALKAVLVRARTWKGHPLVDGETDRTWPMHRMNSLQPSNRRTSGTCDLGSLC